MTRYLIERSIPHAGELTITELKAITQHSLLVLRELEAPIEWIRSTFTHDRMVCLYVAGDEEIVREHARRSGLPIHRISEVTAIIGPGMEPYQ
jgi:hypothetical protein